MRRGGDLAPVVQRLDNFIQWISHYPTVSICAKISVFPCAQANMDILTRAQLGSVQKPWTTFNLKYISDAEKYLIQQIKLSGLWTTGAWSLTHQSTRHQGSTVGWRQKAKTSEHWRKRTTKLADQKANDDRIEYLKRFSIDHSCLLNLPSVKNTIIKIWVPHPSITERSMPFLGGRKTSPWTNFQPNFSWASSYDEV